MCGGEKYFSAVPYSTYDPPRKLQWPVVLDLSRSFRSSSAADTKMCLDLNSRFCVIGVNRSRLWILIVW